MPALSTDLRLLKIQDWVNSGKDDKLMPLITQRCAATGAAAFKCLKMKGSGMQSGNQTGLRGNMCHVTPHAA